MNVLELAKRCIQTNIEELQSLQSRMGEDFLQAVDLLAAHPSRIIFSGIGKSGHIAQKLASTFSSTGSPSVFVHPSDASHGDLGMIADNDLLVIISNSGNSAELKDLINFAARRDIPIVSICGNPDSDLAQASRVHLSAHVEKEACPFNLAPTTSTTVSLALGDALAICVLEKKNFKQEQFAEYHPGGALGRRLLTRVKDLMHRGDTFPLVEPDTPLIEVIGKMTAKEVRGVAGIRGPQGELAGIITDGDLRRLLEKNTDPLSLSAKDVMTTRPKTIFAEEMAERALFIMEEFSIQTLFVLDEETKKPVGLIHLQDLLKAKLR
tara:strand:- start:9030 stop:9998 length:969 start_codon:yes stop_codon:yes gene_type:complete